MKKSLFKLIFGVLAVTMLFTSCLSDGNNEVERQGSFAYITTINNVQCAAVDGIYVTSTLIKSLNVGSCYLISFRISNDMTGNVYNGTDLAQPSLLVRTTSSVSAPAVEDTFNPTALQPTYGSFDSFFGDNWGFIYRVKLEEKSTPRAFFFYDEDKQYEMVDGVRKDLSKNQLIIDVRFTYTVGEGSAVERNELTVGNLKNIKEWYEENGLVWDSSSQKTAEAAIKFRYNQKQSDETVKEDVTVGDWYSPIYKFAYFRD